MKIKSLVVDDLIYKVYKKEIKMERDGEERILPLAEFPEIADKFVPEVKEELNALADYQLEINWKMAYRSKPFSRLDLKTMLARRLGVPYSEVQKMVERKDIEL